MELGPVTVNGNTFVPAGGVMTPTCDLPPATIQITKTGSATGAVNEPLSIQPNDDNMQFRIVDCKYHVQPGDGFALWPRQLQG